MTRPPRHAVACAIIVTSLAVIETVLGRYAEPHDVLAAALAHFNATHLVAVALLLPLRLFLVLLAPGWVLYVLVEWAAAWKRERDAARDGPPAGGAGLGGPAPRAAERARRAAE